MRLVISGQYLSLKDIDPKLDRAFVNLHAAYFSTYAYDLDKFIEIAEEFFSRTIDTPNATEHNTYFENFTVIWNRFLREGRYEEAEYIWKIALQPVRQCEEKNSGHFIHKGTAFYFWGMTAIRSGDLDKGYALMHQALEEDIRTSHERFPDTPAFAFATINYAKAEQAFREWVHQKAQYLNTRINNYRTEYGNSLSIEDFRNRFLSSIPDKDIVFLFSYVIARLYRVSQIPPFALRSPFAGQLEQNILFDIVLVIDAAIKGRHPNPDIWRFPELLLHLARISGCNITESQLKSINTPIIDDFSGTLSGLLNGNLTLSDGTQLSLEERHLAVVYGIRNNSAHRLEPETIIWQRFREIEQVLLNVLFLAVEKLY